MADVDYDAFDGFGGVTPEVEERTPMGAALNWIGAATSVALVVGLSAWGYHLAVRDVSDVPVIRALTGPMRIQPVDPGGAQAAHQGLAVNRVQGAVDTSPPTGEVVLAPPPLDIEDPDADGPSESQAISALPEAYAATPEAYAATPAAYAVTPATPSAAEKPPGETKPSEVSGPVPDDGADAEVQAAILAVAGRIASDGSPRDTSNASTDPGRDRGVRWSTRPKPRSRAEAAEAGARRAIGGELSVAELAPGTRLVQVGDYGSAETARSEWERLRRVFGDYMIGKSPVVMKTQNAGRTFYRLRVAGFGSLDESRRFCAVLLARNATCVPIVHR